MPRPLRRRCRACGRLKRLIFFHRVRDGYRTTCAACVRQYQAQHPDHLERL